MAGRILIHSLAVFFFFFYSAIISNGQSSLIEVSGEVTGHWEADTVDVTGDLVIPFGETLVIDPGVLVRFQGHYRVEVRGSILAIGEEEARITFTSGDTTGFYDTITPAGGWGGFFYEHLDPDTDSSKFQYCNFRFGKAVSGNDSISLYGGAFRVIDFSKIHLKNCLFENNHAYRWGGAVYARNSNIVIRNCQFTQNESGRAVLPWGYGGALCFVSSSPRVESCLFDGNRSTGIGGGASFEYSDAIVRNNIFRNNFSGLGGGLGFLRSQPSQICCDNLITENEALFFGGGIACIAAHTVFANNTVTNNFATYGGAFYCNDSAVPSNYNCLFYNNFAYEGTEVYIWDIRSAPNFYSCNVPGDTAGFAGSGGHEGYHGEYIGNMDTIPEFSDLDPYPFQLKATSPLRDAGFSDTTGLGLPPFDLAGNPRIYQNHIDIGAYEWNPGPGIAGFVPENIPLLASPNPFTNNTAISFISPGKGYVYLSVIDLSGNYLQRESKIPVNKGLNSIELQNIIPSAEKLPAGLFVVVLQNDNRKGSCRIIHIPSQ